MKPNTNIQNENGLHQKKNSPLLKIIKLSIFSIIGVTFLQIGFLTNNYYYFQRIIEEVSDNATDTYKIYDGLHKASLEHDQQQIIEQFTLLHNSKNSIADLLLSGYVLRISQNSKTEHEKSEAEKEWEKKHPEEAEAYRLKLNKETKKFIIESYIKNPKNGIIKDRELFKKVSCLSIDISCNVRKNNFDKFNNKNLDSIENKIDINIYNTKHKKEYEGWMKKFLENAKNSKSNYLPSPGEIAAGRTN